MKYATVCSGIEAPSLAWHGLGWSPVWFSEIEQFPCAVLNYHYPQIPNLGDMTKLHENEIYQTQSIDLLCGGTPCQSFSFAGLRKGLDDERGNLALHFIRILGEKRPTWFVWENVPGVLSSANGRDFATILAGFTGRNIAIPKNGWGNAGAIEGIADAYGIAWATLDAQYFGVPQRRRRIFVVGHLGNWKRAAAVLFDTACLSGYPAPKRETRQGIAGRIAPCVGSGGKAAGSVTQQDVENGVLVYRWQNADAGVVKCDVTAPLLAHGGATDERKIAIVLAHGQANAEIVSDGEPSLTCNHEAPIVFDLRQVTSPTNRSNPKQGDPACTLAANSDLCIYGLPGNWIGRKPENGGNQTEPFHDLSPCLTKTDQHAVAFGWQNSETQGDSVGEVCPTLDKSKTPAVFQPRIARNGRGALSETAYPLIADSGKTGTGDSAQCVVCFAQNSRDELREMDVSGALSASPGMKQTSYLRHQSIIRRFTPKECERLQGMPDYWTRIPMRTLKFKKITKLRPADRWEGNVLMAADGPRYRAIGNSMAVPVMRWIGERIDFIHNLTAQ
jgi:DNA (cytosine-5)-methyltransferase 1